MDVFSADLPVDAFQQGAGRRLRSPTIDPATAARIVAGAGAGASVPCSTPAAACCRRRRHRRTGRAGRGARGAGRAHADGQGLPARGPSAAARPDRILGHADRQRDVPHGRSHRRRRHAPGRGQLELVGSAVHLLDPADAADPHRRRRGRDRPQLPDRTRRRRRRQARRWRRSPTAARGTEHRDRGRAARGHRARAPGVCGELGRTSGARTSSRCGPSASSSELRKAVPEDGFIVTDVGWNKNGVGAAVPDHRARHVHHAERSGDHGVRSGGGAGRQAGAPESRGGGARRRRRLQRRTRPSSPRPWRPSCPSSGWSWTMRLRHDRRSRVHALRLELRLHVRARAASRTASTTRRWRARSARAA